jgi:signal transduction histidine kinase/CheY-like chemotaxis protein
MEEVCHHRAESAQTLESLAYANRQLALANERTADLRAIAENALKAKTSFMANVSHEFRTPLNMIVGLVELMIGTPEIYDVLPSPKMREDLRVVHRNCEHVSKMIDDILDLTRIEAGHQAIHREWVDLQEIVEDSIMAIRALLETKRLAVEVSLPDNLPNVYCDRTRIQQVILNLLSNAARFTEEGEITIEVERHDQHVLVNVKDTGPGIPPEDVGRIFEPFCQGTGELWRNKGGSGLGLSISERFVRLHGGRMWVQSELGAGTSFSFTLPVSPPIEHIVRPGHHIREDWEWRKRTVRTDKVMRADELYKPRVIVCDETGDLYAAFSRYSSEVEFVDARNLEQVTEELQQCPAHAVIINTASFDGQWATVDALGRQVPDTPIVGCSVPRSIERAIAAGAQGYLVKPVTRADLVGAIQAVGSPVERILIVDDDTDALQLFSRMLRVCQNTLEIVTASSGRQALDELRRKVPDLVLLDIRMPDMDGWQILQWMNQDEGMRRIPTFFLSAQDPADQPPVSQSIVATMGQGLSLDTVLRCSLEISSLLLKPGAALDLAPVSTHEVAQALVDRVRHQETSPAPPPERLSRPLQA